MSIKHIIVLLALSPMISFGQLYEGYSTYKERYLLQIDKDSSITYIYNTKGNTLYTEYRGRIQKLTDSTYAVKAELSIGQYVMKSFDKDTLYIQLDSQIAHQLDVIEIEYANGKNRIQLQGSDPKGHAIPMLRIPVNKALFNEKKGYDFVKITINRKNWITDEWLTFKINYGSAASFSKGGEIELIVTIADGVLRIIGDKPTQTGHILLKAK